MIFLERHAGKVVILAWLLVMLSIGAALTIGVAAGISNFYHPYHRDAPYAATWVQIVQAACVLGIAVAVAASFALSLKSRSLAAVSVIGTWIALIVGSFAAMALTKPGPEFFSRYIGNQRHLVPWQYQPDGRDVPSNSTLRVHLCVSTLRGNYDSEYCPRTSYVTVRPAANALYESFDQRYWRERQSDMRQGELRQGYASYISDGPSSKVPSVTRYYARYDDKGNLVRFVRCYRPTECHHQTLAGGYDITYDTVEIDTPIAHWDWKDGDLARLIASWRTPD